jgi:hypothetical protein
MTPARKIPEDIYETPAPNEPDRPSGSWPQRIETAVNEIKDAVLGTFDKEGIIARVRRLELIVAVILWGTGIVGGVWLAAAATGVWWAFTSGKLSGH